MYSTCSYLDLQFEQTSLAWNVKRMIRTSTSWSFLGVIGHGVRSSVWVWLEQFPLNYDMFYLKKKGWWGFTQHSDVDPFACFSAELKVPASRSRRRQNNWRQTLRTCHKLWTMRLPHHSSNQISVCTNGMWKGWIYDKWVQGPNDFKWIAKYLRVQWTWSGIKNRARSTLVSFCTSWGLWFQAWGWFSRLVTVVSHCDSRAILYYLSFADCDTLHVGRELGKVDRLSRPKQRLATHSPTS